MKVFAVNVLDWAQIKRLNFDRLENIEGSFSLCLSMVSKWLPHYKGSYILGLFDKRDTNEEAVFWRVENFLDTGKQKILFARIFILTCDCVLSKLKSIGL